MASTQKKVGGIDKWEVENALSTLRQAGEIKSDVKMMKAVKIQVKREQAQLRKMD